MLIRKDQKSNADDRRAEAQKRSKESSALGKSVAEKKNFVDIAALVRSLQRDEGHIDCFRKGAIDCDEIDCKWRTFCLEGRQILSGDKP